MERVIEEGTARYREVPSTQSGTAPALPSEALASQTPPIPGYDVPTILEGQPEYDVVHRPIDGAGELSGEPTL